MSLTPRPLLYSTAVTRPESLLTSLMPRRAIHQRICVGALPGSWRTACPPSSRCRDIAPPGGAGCGRPRWPPVGSARAAGARPTVPAGCSGSSGSCRRGLLHAPDALAAQLLGATVGGDRGGLQHVGERIQTDLTGLGVQPHTFQSSIRSSTSSTPGPNEPASSVSAYAMTSMNS